MPQGSRHFLRENGNLFNVAVSRARAVLHVVGNRNWASRCGIPHVEGLAHPEECRPSAPPKSPWYPHESPYEELLFKALVEAGLTPSHNIRCAIGGWTWPLCAREKTDSNWTSRWMAIATGIPMAPANWMICGGTLNYRVWDGR